MSSSSHVTSQVLIFAEGDYELALDIVRNLADAAYLTKLCTSYAEAIDWVCRHANHPPDAIVIDVPEQRSSQSMNAFKFYGFLRKGGWVPGLQQRFGGWGDDVPVLMLVSAAHRLEIEERMYALSVLPDKIDYKPYKAHILVSKIDSLLPDQRDTTPGPADQIVRVRSLVIDPSTETVMVNGEPLKLSYLEYELLYYLVSHANTPLSRETLLSDIWGITGAKAMNNRNVDVYVGRLRRKLAHTDCHDLIGRGRNGAYILEMVSALDFEPLTEPEGFNRPPESSDDRLPAALLRRESGESHLPRELVLRNGSAHNKSGCKIGRNPSQCDCVLMDKRISRWHATIFVADGIFYLRDENSTGHTYITRHNMQDGSERQRLSPREPASLGSGDLIHFNTVGYRFVLED